MNASPDVRHAYLDALAAIGERLPGARVPWLRELRERGRAVFAAAGFPTTREEAWRYTNLASLARQRFELAAADAALDAAALRAAWFDALDAYRLVFVDGSYRAELSSPPSGGGVAVGSLREMLARDPQALEGRLGAIAPADRHALAALNTAFLLDGAYVHLAAGAAPERPIQILYFASTGALTQPRTLIVAEAGSRAVVIEQYCGTDAARYFSNAVTEIALGERARIEHYRVQQQGAQGYHIGGLYVRQERGSELVSNALDLGGLLVRHDLQSALAEGAACTLNGLYLAGGRQHVDNHTLIEHAAPHSTSRELYKGVLDGRARAVFNGRVVVRPGAQRSDAQQTNNNLLLSEDAEIDTKPELEIYADDVKCTHGATVGQLDSDQLFYLRSRGLDADAARDLLTFAFANEVLQRFGVAPMRTALDRQLLGRLLQGRAIEEVELV
ncbi:MAG TPA: Fe-S cluster assembly protein SufD [Burkholderiales bacterium]